MTRLQIYVLIFGVLIIEFFVLLFANLSKDLPDPFKLTVYVPSLSTKIYDKNGELITELFHEKRELVYIDEVSKYVIYAFISIEDRNFFKHAGINP
ncbi:MAG: transglycosylase domain-containing protein, partial [bacterium]|nr:transglycosylase domain-containing protein [bacterium]